MNEIKMTSSIRNALYAVGSALIVTMFVGYMYFPIRFKTENQVPNSSADSVQDHKMLTRENCLADDCLTIQELNYPVKNLPVAVKEALEMALMDEYKALATYIGVLDTFGQVRPFSMIKGAEEQHIAALKSLYDKYGLDIPGNELIGKVDVPGTLQLSCQLGVEAEIENAALYREKLLPAVSEYEDITSVFTNLMNASQQKHLRAFERCN